MQNQTVKMLYKRGKKSTSQQLPYSIVHLENLFIFGNQERRKYWSLFSTVRVVKSVEKNREWKLTFLEEKKLDSVTQTVHVDHLKSLTRFSFLHFHLSEIVVGFEKWRLPLFKRPLILKPENFWRTLKSFFMYIDIFSLFLFLSWPFFGALSSKLFTCSMCCQGEVVFDDERGKTGLHEVIQASKHFEEGMSWVIFFGSITPNGRITECIFRFLSAIFQEHVTFSLWNPFHKALSQEKLFIEIWLDYFPYRLASPCIHQNMFYFLAIITSWEKNIEKALI